MALLKTKSMIEVPSLEDGLRVCVMSRLTENDGITPVPEWVQGKHFDLWYQLLAPDDSLVGWWYREKANPKNWPRFQERYFAQIREPTRRILMHQLGEMSLEYNVTLLCVEPEPDYCHRRLLAEEIERIVPDVRTLIE